MDQETNTNIKRKCADCHAPATRVTVRFLVTTDYCDRCWVVAGKPITVAEIERTPQQDLEHQPQEPTQQ